jgi:hypothetical protein
MNAPFVEFFDNRSRRLDVPDENDVHENVGGFFKLDFASEKRFLQQILENVELEIPWNAII